MRYRRAAVFTDIHWGKHSNSGQHNQDCLDFINWFIKNIEKDGNIDHIIFMGDWFESRSSVNISTLYYSHIAASKLNDLGLPVFFIIGNHDLYYRTSRDIYSTVNFHAFSDFIVIDHPVYNKEIGNGTLLCPFIFPEEYAGLAKYNELETWFGHFAFKDFEVNTYGYVLDHGPNYLDFNGPNFIFSGHFHKRQVKENICYIGNSFPMDAGDSGDFKRGMMIYDHEEKIPSFIDWKECPKYVKVKLTDLIDGRIEIPNGAVVKCLVDYNINYSESTAIRNLFMKKYSLRSFTLEETAELAAAIRAGAEDIVIDESQDLTNVDELVTQYLHGIKIDKINSKKLIEIYTSL